MALSSDKAAPGVGVQPVSEDLRLMQLVSEGDERAQRVLVHRLISRAQRLCRRIIADPADAEDASQVALLEILRSAGGFRDESSIERWADRIVARTALGHVRKARRGRLGWLPLEAAGDVAARPKDNTLRMQTPRSVIEYLDRLSGPRREVLVLKHVMGFTVDEISELSGVAPGTVKDRLIAARKQIRKMIQRDLAVGVRGGGSLES